VVESTNPASIESETIVTMSRAHHSQLAAILGLAVAVGCGDPGTAVPAADGPPSAVGPGAPGPTAPEDPSISGTEAATPRGAGVEGPPDAAPPGGAEAPARLTAADAAAEVDPGGQLTVPVPARTPSTLDILLASVAYPGPSPEIPAAPDVVAPVAEAGSAPAGAGAAATAPARVVASAGQPAEARAQPGSPGPNAATRAAQGRRPTSAPAPTRTRAPTAPPPPTEDRSVLAALRRGGLVIYLRHGQTDWSQNARELAWVPEMLADPGLLDDCDRQRLLTDAGRDQARAIGDAVRRLGIPVGRVIASPWCRTRETAELAFGGAEVARGRLFDTGYLAFGSDEWRGYIDKLRGMLAEAPAGGNAVIVGHMPPLRDAAGVTLVEGEAAIFRPDGSGFDLLARTGPDGWERIP